MPWAGGRWWAAEASDFAEDLYRPLQMTAGIVNTSTAPNDRLMLTLANPAWSVPRKIDDFLPGHGRLMHLRCRRFLAASISCTPMWSTGMACAETMVASLTVPRDLAGTPLGGDDAAGVRGESPDGAHVGWVRDPVPPKAHQASIFKFAWSIGGGAPVQDAELYMGMLGHAAFVKNDGTTFAHVHPSGSVPMAALVLANPAQGEDHTMRHTSGLPPEADFPYGFPSPGDYRVIVQMKHGGVIETGIFDAKVE